MGGNYKSSLRSKDFDVLITTVKHAREAAGLSQREIAKRIGLYPTVYGRVERGDRVLDVVEFVAIARAIGIDPLRLFADYLVALEQSRIENKGEPPAPPDSAVV